MKTALMVLVLTLSTLASAQSAMTLPSLSGLDQLSQAQLSALQTSANVAAYAKLKKLGSVTGVVELYNYDAFVVSTSKGCTFEAVARWKNDMWNGYAVNNSEMCK